MIFVSVAVLGSLLYGSAYAQIDDSVDNSQYHIIAVSGAVIGAIFSVVNHVAKKTDKFSIKKFLSALITAVVSAVALANVGAIPQEASTGGVMGVFVAYLIIGWGVDKGLSRLDK